MKLLTAISLSSRIFTNLATHQIGKVTFSLFHKCDRDEKSYIALALGVKLLKLNQRV
jgi:hypothetical protein